MRRDRDFRIEVDWSSSDGVVTPEFAATWCRLSIWVRDRCVTTVDAADSGLRRSVYAAAYPLAEWIAYNWWPLVSEVRPSAVSTPNWTWSRLASNGWLRRHNLRSAGNGMSWPDLTIVPEGSVSVLAWNAGAGMSGQRVRFLENGFDSVDSVEVERELRRFVLEVLDRLDEFGLKSALAQEWDAIIAADQEEAAFARAASRLGLDPYSLSETVADDIVALSDELDDEMLQEFLDSADPAELRSAVSWMTQARELALRPAETEPISDLRQDVQHLGGTPPFLRGYDRAHQLRGKLSLSATDAIDLGSMVSKEVLDRPSAGLEGYVRADDFVRLVLPSAEMSPSAIRFAQAKSLGLALAGSRTEYLLDPARTDTMKQARAFAAELLAPAEGIAAFLAELPASTDSAFEAIARRFNVSPLLVRHQYDNQLSAHQSSP